METPVFPRSGFVKFLMTDHRCGYPMEMNFISIDLKMALLSTRFKTSPLCPPTLSWLV